MSKSVFYEVLTTDDPIASEYSEVIPYDKLWDRRTINQWILFTTVRSRREAVRVTKLLLRIGKVKGVYIREVKRPEPEPEPEALNDADVSP